MDSMILMKGNTNLKKSSIYFIVNGKPILLNDVDPLMSLNSWLRSQPGLTGTKVMCEEGGCGSCIVAMEKRPGHVVAINSCLALLGTIDGCIITTVEGLGSKREGFHKIQSRIAEFNGSQCGYCTPGFVMNLHSLLSNGASLSQREIEDSFDGNICRCTGYRPILDSVKSFACDADPKLLSKITDIEDLEKKCSRLSTQNGLHNGTRCIEINRNNTTWIRPCSLKELYETMKKNQSAELVCGNTATGIYKRSVQPRLLLDISRLEELLICEESENNFTFGSCLPINQMVKALCSSTSSDKCKAIAGHARKIASVPIRNVGSWAGNLMIKYAHRDFPSDMFVLLEAADAEIKLHDVTTNTTLTCSPEQLLDIKMNHKVILSVKIPKSKDNAFKSFKVMPRWQNAHAYVNVAFEAVVSSSKFSEVVRPRLVFGGVSERFCHASNTEAFLMGKSVNSGDTLSGALSVLFDEIQPVQANPVDASVQYKHNLAIGLFYKFYLSLCDPNLLGPGIESGISQLKRPVSSGEQVFDVDPNIFPVSQTIPKLSSKYQASGEAVYISDKIPSPEELHCAFVTAQVANADIERLDYTEASEMDGFFTIITGSNLPTEVTNTHLYPFDISQPMIATDHVEFAGQPLAIVVAGTREQARSIANAVKVTYKNRRKPILTIKDAISAESFFSIPSPEKSVGDVEQALKNARNKVSGELHFGHQYHFFLETQIARAELTEEGGFKLDCATQTQKWVQDAVAFAFNTSANKVEVNTKRIGGGYGGKATNSLIISCAAALASYCTKRPVCFHADLKTSMATFGTRTPYSFYYTVGFEDDGTLNAIDCKMYTNSGPTSMDGEIDEEALFMYFGDSAYRCPNRRYENFMCKSNIPSTTWCRSPGSIQLSAFLDQVLEHVACHLQKDPVAVKWLNLYKDGDTDFSRSKLEHCNLQKIYSKILKDYEIAKRQQEILIFNQKNKWKKKGLSLTPMRYKVDGSWGRYTVLLSVCSGDGTVIVSHGGIEMGQGINTKVAQVVAYQLGIPVESVMVQRTNTITGSNSEITGGSITSEIACRSALECCKIICSRVEPFRAKMAEGYRWRDLIAHCFNAKVDLAVSHCSFPDEETSVYNSYGVTATQVELDILTGEFNIDRVDTVFDCGISLNPSIDVGQVEGAFVMGLGFWLTENFVYDQETGKLLTDGTWEYKPPTTKDIPIVWNVELLRNTPNPVGTLRSKASGEPPMCMAVSVIDALRRALESSKRDREKNGYFQMPTPSTVEGLQLAAELNPLKDFSL